VSAHTPGPWEIDYDTRPADVCCVHGLPPYGEDKQKFAYVRGAIGYWDADEAENLANIHLIAAAPELLAALQSAEAFIAGFEGDDLQDGIDAKLADIRAAIAKAIGSAS